MSRRKSAESAVSLVSGALFGFGLAVAGMTRPEKVIGFLSFFRRWDPSLMFVMAGAIAVHAVAYRIIKRRRTPILSPRFMIPSRRDIDARLLVGAGIFGVGWALGGFCPGPGIASLASGAPSVLVFVVTMLMGNLLAARMEPSIERMLRKQKPAAEA
jgi:uncharacterized protein